MYWRTPPYLSLQYCSTHTRTLTPQLLQPSQYFLAAPEAGRASPQGALPQKFRCSSLSNLPASQSRPALSRAPHLTCEAGLTSFLEDGTCFAPTSLAANPPDVVSHDLVFAHAAGRQHQRSHEPRPVLAQLAEKHAWLTLLQCHGNQLQHAHKCNTSITANWHSQARWAGGPQHTCSDLAMSACEESTNI